MLRADETTAPAEVGRRVFIKGLAATGALVGGLAVAGPASAQEAGGVPARARGRRPSPFSSGWTSQPGRFFDDVSLPDGFTYDVVASYRDRIGGGETFGYNNDFIASFPLVEDRGTRRGCSGSTTSTPTRSSPDNLVFDRLGNLWMVTDISSSALNVPTSPYAWQRNNGIFMIRVGGPDAGVAFRFGSVPNEAESTGPIWSPRQDTMFLAIQHPGEETSVKGGVYGDPATCTSYWPRGNKTTGENPSEPLPSVIAIRRS